MEKKYLLHNYLNGTATKDEIAALQADPEYAAYVRIADTAKTFDTPAFNVEKNKNKIEAGIAGASKVRNLNPVRTFLKVAAAIAVLAVGYWFISTMDTSMSTGIGEKISVSLPDASEVILNANSEITYSKGNWENERNVTLNGEAFFKVNKGSTFHVSTSLGDVRVLGTQFNVYSRDRFFNVSCYEGLVSVAFNDTLIKLPAGTKLKVEEGTLVMYNTTSNTVPNWTKNESSFENATLQTVISELERQYPITINTQLQGTDKRFTGSFTHSDLELALTSVCDPLQLTYSINEGEVTIYAKGSP